MDNNRIGLRAALRELAAEESGAAGPHVGLKRLIAYREGTLPVGQRDALQEHLSLCKRCTELLRELRDFEAAAARGAAAAAGPDALRQDAWESLSRSLPGKTSVIRPISSATRRVETREQRFPRFLPALAAALLLAIVGLSAWSVVTVRQGGQRVTRLEQRLEEREAAIADLRTSLADAERQLDAARGKIQGLETGPSVSAGPSDAENDPQVDALTARVAELNAALEELRRTTPAPAESGVLVAAQQEIELSVSPRFALRGKENESGLLQSGGAVNPVPMPADEDRFSFALSLADHPAYGEYRFELLQDGEVLWGGRRPAGALLGDAGLRVSVRGLGPGLYRLRIEGVQPERTDLLGEYILKVERGEAE